MWVLLCKDADRTLSGDSDCTGGYTAKSYTDLESADLVLSCPFPINVAAKYSPNSACSTEQVVMSGTELTSAAENYVFVCNELASDFFTNGRYSSGCSHNWQSESFENIGRIYMHEFDSELYDLIWTSFWEFFVMGLTMGIIIALIMKLKR